MATTKNNMNIASWMKKLINETKHRVQILIQVFFKIRTQYMVMLTFQFSEKSMNYLIYGVKVMGYSPGIKKQTCNLQQIQTIY